MGERKVLNKYYPPEFDPSKLSKARRSKNQQFKVRAMLPMSIRCNTCGNYIYKGTKFNSRKEDVVGETYLGIQTSRFYFKCTKCSAELMIKTNPQNSDYVVEFGATRNFEPSYAGGEEDQMEKRREAEEMGDAMKSLQNRTSRAKREMDILAALDEMKSMRTRHATVSVDAMLETLRQTAVEKEKKLKDEDVALIMSVFHTPKEYVQRIHDEDVEMSNDNLKMRRVSVELPDKANDVLMKAALDDSGNQETSCGSETDTGGKLFIHSRGISLVKKPATSGVKKAAHPEQKKDGDNKTNTTSGLVSLCQNCGSEED